MTVRASALVVVLAAVAAACGTTANVASTPPSSSSTTTTSTSVPATTTSTTAPTTTATTTSTSTTTTTLPSTLDIEGSPIFEFTVSVGDDIELNRDELVAFVIETLSDERSWMGRGVGWRLVDEGGTFEMIVASPDEVDRLCRPLQTLGKFSCARWGIIAINSDRWFGATEDWPGDLETYRRYLVNHEFGHYVVGGGHPGCPGTGEIAPVMMQQTKGLNGCEPNGWVDP